MKKKKNKEQTTYRFENFGGIIASQKPPFLAFVDRQYMRELDLNPPQSSDIWDGDETVGILSAPTEVHFAVTNRCSNRCEHCYMDAGDPDPGELDTAAFKAALDILAQMKVFHTALGGGEALERPDLFEIAAYARQIGLVPNLTISGRGLSPGVAGKLTDFGQVNLSLDGVDDDSAPYRDIGMFETVDRAFDMLTAAGVSTGINCVLGSSNFAGIEALFRYARKKKLNEIEFLRFKPSGRGKELYNREKTTYEQNIELLPLLTRMTRKYKVTAKIDCSFVPMYCYHRPAVEMLEATATYGCEAGNVLLGIRSDGSVAGCSFLENTDIDVFDLPTAFKESPGVFDSMRNWTERAVEPCRSCDYLQICKGGCHGVAQFVTSDFDAPDPGCPTVVEYKNERTVS